MTNQRASRKCEYGCKLVDWQYNRFSHFIWLLSEVPFRLGVDLNRYKLGWEKPGNPDDIGKVQKTT